MRTCTLVQVLLKFKILSRQPSKCWSYRHVPPCLVIASTVVLWLLLGLGWNPGPACAGLIPLNRSSSHFLFFPPEFLFPRNQGDALVPECVRSLDHAHPGSSHPLLHVEILELERKGRAALFLLLILTDDTKLNLILRTQVSNVPR